MNIEDLIDQPPRVLDALPVDVLYNLQHQAEAHAKSAAQMLAIVQGVLQRRYADGLNSTGVHHRTDGGYAIKIDVPKRVDWDQSAIAEAVETIKTWGENPAEYVDTKLTVSETRFKAWPSAIRDLFAPARTVKAGKPKIELAREVQEAA